MPANSWPKTCAAVPREVGPRARVHEDRRCDVPLGRDITTSHDALNDGAKETRTPDPLHAMQVLYQLSYGPVAAPFRRPKSLQRGPPGAAHTWRHTATRRPCTVTWSAGTTIGA